VSSSVNLPAPFGGINKKTPIAALNSPYCEELLNFNTTEAGIELRNGDSLWSYVHNTGPATTDTFLGFVKYGDIKLFYAAEPNAGNTRYFDITSAGAPSLAHTSAAATINSELFTLYFNKYVYTFGPSTAGGDYYNGSAWASWTWTFPTINPIGGCAFKNRAYFVPRGSATYGYGGIGAITGTVTEVDLAGIILEQSYLSTIAPITIVNNGATLQLLAFAFFSGEVLFYAGSYPDSASWELIGRGKVGKPLSYNSSIDFQGDALLRTRIGLVSLRDVFLSGGQMATTKTVSEEIDPIWISLVNVIIAQGGSTYNEASTGRVKRVFGDWWPSKNRIVISFPIKVVDGNLELGNTYFVFDTLRKSWSVHRSFGIGGVQGLTHFKDNIYISGGDVAAATTYLTVMQKEGGTDFQDDNYDAVTSTDYDFEMLTAPIPFPKTAVYQASLIEPILESDLYGQTNWNFVVDFGRQTSGDQTTDASTTAVAKPAVNVGMQNITFVQVKMSGTTTSGKSVGLDLYSYNVWYNAGDKGSR